MKIAKNFFFAYLRAILYLNLFAGCASMAVDGGAPHTQIKEPVRKANVEAKDLVEGMPGMEEINKDYLAVTF